VKKSQNNDPKYSEIIETQRSIIENLEVNLKEIKQAAEGRE
jgi:hypothetical protein